MATGLLSPDDELIARLQAPPDLDDGVESLAYWRARRRRLPWYRPRARREAARMTVVWERRVRAALLRQRGAPVEARFRAAGLVVGGQFGRWAKRWGLGLAGTTFLLLVLAPALLVVELLLKLF